VAGTLSPGPPPAQSRTPVLRGNCTPGQQHARRRAEDVAPSHAATGGRAKELKPVPGLKVIRSRRMIMPAFLILAAWFSVAAEDLTKDVLDKELARFEGTW